MTALTPRSREILEWIQDFCWKNDFFPTFREIQAGFGYKSVSPVQGHIRHLKSAGLVISDPHKARTLRLAEAKSRGIPIEGEIAAGGFVHRFGDTFSDQCEKNFIPPHLFSPRSRDLGRFALKVNGDSMIGAHIVDGDFVILDKPSDPKAVKNGAIVAARLNHDDQTTLKRWYREGTQVFLVPENPEYAPISVEVSEIVIEGIYVGLIRGDLL